MAGSGWGVVLRKMPSDGISRPKAEKASVIEFVPQLSARLAQVVIPGYLLFLDGSTESLQNGTVGAVAFGSLLSGGFLTTYGCTTVLWLSFITLALVGVVLSRPELRSKAHSQA